MSEDSKGYTATAGAALAEARRCLDAGLWGMGVEALQRAAELGAPGEAVGPLKLALARGQGDETAVRAAARDLLGLDAPAKILAAAALALRDQGDVAEAGRAADRSLAADPHCLSALAVAAWAAARTGDPAKALVHRDALAALEPDNPEWPVEAARLMLRLGQVEAAIERLNTALSRFPDHIQAAVALTRALMDAGRIEAAAAAAAEAARRGAAEAAVLQLELAVGRAREDWPLVARLAERLAEVQTPPSPQPFLALATAYRRLNDPAAAYRAAKAALELDPALISASVIAAWATARLGDGEASIALYRHLAQREPDESRWPIEVSLLLNVCGRVPEARAELAKVRARWPDDRLQRAASGAPPFGAPATPDGPAIPGALDAELRAGLPDRFAEVRLARPLMVDHPDRDVILAEQPGADTVVAVFTGYNDRAMSTPLHVFDWHLAALGVSAIYLKDFSRLLYFRGVQSLGDLKATCAALQDMVRQSGAKRLCAIGMSAGGAAALRYGVELRAARISSFAGPTRIGDPTLIDVRHRIVERRLAEAGLNEPLDIREFLISRRSSARIDLVYGAGMPRDRGYALHLGDLPGVTLHPQPGQDCHNIIPQLAKTGQLKPLLAELLA
jgi:tetratricopeptide (TPR) repeat protein